MKSGCLGEEGLQGFVAFMVWLLHEASWLVPERRVASWSSLPEDL